MTPRAFCQHGKAEGLKAVWHGAMAALALGACAYNVAAFAFRRRPHLFVNAAIYGLATFREVQKVTGHVKDWK